MSSEHEMLPQPYSAHPASCFLRPFTLADAPDVQRLAGALEVASTTAMIPASVRGWHGRSSGYAARMQGWCPR